MVGWHHRLNGHEFEQVLGDGDGQESLAYYIPWGCKELDMTEFTSLLQIKLYSSVQSLSCVQLCDL